ncbi:MAG: ThuA domain-containing protein [Blautia sp.]|nr:ThuA domain-containing protein [Blautia sp.]
MPAEEFENFKNFLNTCKDKIKAVYPEGVTGAVVNHLQTCEDMKITHVNQYMDQCGLPDELLNNTDVLIWWAHVSHDMVPDELVKKIVERVHRGMGFIALHSAHKSKPFTELLGTSGTLKWREGDFCRVWNIHPTHPIAQGIPEYFELEPEEMYGEPFDIPTPEDTVFLSWFRGGELIRSGCTWTRGYGKVFYFQPGHETYPTYHNGYALRIIENAVRWAAPVLWRTDMTCPNTKALED